MIPVRKNKIFYNLDSVFDIESLLSLEDDFYQLFSRNYSKASHAWAAGGISLDTEHPYLQKNPGLYHTYHNRDFDFSLNSMAEKSAQSESNNDWSDELAVYLQLKFGAVSPYQFLHIVNHSGDNENKKVCLHDWVYDFPRLTDWIFQLPFEKFKNISLIFTPKFVQQGYHRDFNLYPIEKPHEVQAGIPDLDTDIIWCRFRLDRPFYLYDIGNNGEILKEVPLEGYTATFNHYNWHGNIHPAKEASLTVKLEGNFSEDFANKINNI